MTESLFTSQTPDVGKTDLSDGGAGLVRATTMYAVVAGTISAIRWFTSVTVPPGTPIVGLWTPTSDIAGTRLASDVNVTTPFSSGAWVTQAITPTHVAANTYFLPTIVQDTRYVAASGFFTAAGLSNGNLRAIKGGTDPLAGGFTLGDGKLAFGGSAFPDNSSGTQNCYFVDVVFTADGASENHNVTCSATLSLALAAADKKGAKVAVSALLSLVAAETGGKSGASVTVSVALGLAIAASRTPPVAAASTGSWWSLVSILQEAASEETYQIQRDPIACPNDGEPLRTGPHGELYCPFDGWRWSG